MTSETGYIGVDVGARNIKMVQLNRRDGQIHVVDAVVVPRSRPWELNDWQKFAPTSSSGELVAARELGSFSGRRASQTMTMGLCDVRMIKSPVSNDDAQNRASVLRHLKTIERFGVHPRQFDYWKLPDAWKTDEPGMYVISLRLDWAEQLVEDHDRANMQCRVLDGIPTALARLTAWSGHRHRHPQAILDWGYSRATFSLAFDGKPVFVRMLRSCGLNRIIECVATSLHLCRDEAEDLLMTVGINGRHHSANSVERKVEQLIRGPMQQLKEELLRTLRFVKADRNNAPPENMYLFGGGACLPGVDAWLSEQTGIQARPWELSAEAQLSGSHGRVPAALVGAAAATSSLGWSMS